MKLLLDTNIILDLLLDRAPFAEAAAQLVSNVEGKKILAWLCATTVTTIHYLVEKEKSKTVADEAIKTLLSLFRISEVNEDILAKAVNNPIADFEDAVLYEAACTKNCDAIVTRNARDFKKSAIQILTAEEALNLII